MPKKIDVNGLDHYHDKVSAMVADEYSSSATYAVGDYCFHAGTLYKCTTAITTAEAWTSGHWTDAKLADDTSALKTAITRVSETGILPLNKNIVWNNGYINTAGKVISSSLSKYSSPFLLKAGETVTVTTTNSNIGIICSTTSDTVSVGDTVTVIETTNSVTQEETHSYTATEDIKIIICVLWSNYSYDIFTDTMILSNNEKVNELDELVSNMNETIYFDVDNAVLGINSNIFTQKPNYYAGSSGWTENSSYKAFYFTAEEDFDCYIDEMPWYYFSICLYSNGAVNSTNFIGNYRKNGPDDNTLPTINNKLHVRAGYVFVVSVTNTVTGFSIYTTLKKDIDELAPVLRLVKVGKDADKVTIMQKNLTYEIVKDVNNGINLSTWRIKNYSVNGKIYSNMEIEGVILQQNASDFIGGYHGDEQYTSVGFYIDGVNIAENETVALQSASKVTIFVQSDVYYCGTENKAFTRYVELEFFDNVCRITNRWVYVGTDDFVVDRYPAGMFSMNNSDIHGYTTNITPYLIQEATSPSSQEITKAEFIGDGFGISVEFIGERNMDCYRGQVDYFSTDNPPRQKVYLMSVFGTQGTLTLHTDDVLTSVVEIKIY